MDVAPLLTSQVARRFNVSSETIRQWERSGRLPAMKTVGGIRLFDPREIERLATELERRQPTPAAV